MLHRLARYALAAGLVTLVLLVPGCLESAPENRQETPSPTAGAEEDRNSLPREEGEALEEELNTTDLAIEIDRSAKQLNPGDVVTYEVTVVNNGPNPATDVQVVSSLPGELTYADDDTGCNEISDREITCELGEIPARESLTIAMEVIVEPGSPSDADIRYEATVENRAGRDPAPDNNRAINEAGYSEGSGTSYSIVA